MKIANKTEKKLLISLTRPETRIDQKLLTLFLWWCVDRRWFVLLHWWLLLLLAYTVNIYGMISGSMDVYRDNSFFFCVCEPMWTHFITRTDTESLWLFRFFFCICILIYFFLFYCTIYSLTYTHIKRKSFVLAHMKTLNIHASIAIVHNIPFFFCCFANIHFCFIIIVNLNQAVFCFFFFLLV